jgi:hypothetical protein
MDAVENFPTSPSSCNVIPGDRVTVGGKKCNIGRKDAMQCIYIKTRLNITDARCNSGLQSEEHE